MFAFECDQCVLPPGMLRHQYVFVQGSDDCYDPCNTSVRFEVQAPLPELLGRVASDVGKTTIDILPEF
jgi:hypothetical protein